MKNLKTNFKTLLFHSSWALTLTSGLSYFLGFVRDRVLAQTYGLGTELDIYNAAFVIPDLILSIVIGTTLSAAFLPVFTKQYDEKKSQGFAYAQQIMSWGILVVGILAAGAAITLPYFAHKMVPGFDPEATRQYITLTRLLLISPLIFTLSNIYGRMLLSFKEFLWYGLSPALYNLGIVIGALFLAPIMGIKGIVFGALLGGFFHLSVRLINIKRRKYNFKHKISFKFTPEIKETLLLTAPKIVQYSLWGFMLASFTSIASNLDAGSVTVYNYARNFQSIPVSLLGIAIALAMYPTLSHDAGRGNYKKFIRDFKSGRLRSFAYTTLAAITLAIIAKPLIQILFGGGEFGQKEVHLLATVLQVYCIAIPLESLMHAYHRAYYSLKNTLIPAGLHTLTISLTIIIAKQLSATIGVYAIPVAFSIGAILQVLMLSLIFPTLIKNKMRANATK